MKILVDSSVWIDFLRNGNDSLLTLLNAGTVVINDIIFLELAPQLEFSKNKKVADLLRNQMHTSMNIDFKNLYELRILCLKKGINGIGIPDLMIAQYAIQNNLTIYSLDKHFGLMTEAIPINVI